jgi:hypothetical protein
MRPRATGFLLAGLAAATPAAAQQYRAAEPYPGNESGLVRCESSKGRTRTCQADTRGGVRVTKQLSRTPCVEGQTWGVRPGEIWVKAGCRAEFGLGTIDATAAGPLYFKCESNSGGRRHCPVSTVGGVKIVRQLSQSACIQHATWGFDRNSVWVSQGCRAEFQAGIGKPNVELGPQSVRCESDRGRERRCDVGVWKGAQLTRQLSKSPCVQGHSWGWDARGVWVSRGCRAEFTVW